MHIDNIALDYYKVRCYGWAMPNFIMGNEGFDFVKSIENGFDFDFYLMKLNILSNLNLLSIKSKDSIHFHLT